MDRRWSANWERQTTKFALGALMALPKTKSRQGLGNGNKKALLTKPCSQKKEETDYGLNEYKKDLANLQPSQHYARLSLFYPSFCDLLMMTQTAMRYTYSPLQGLSVHCHSSQKQTRNAFSILAG